MSGVVYGLFGYAWVRGRLDPTCGLYIRPDVVFWMVGFFFLCMTPLISGVANWAHGGGLVTGAALGYLAYTIGELRRHRRR
jgi:GlpG protein